MNLRRSRPDDWPTAHDRARVALSAQLDGELDAPETDWLDAHLSACADCRATADAYADQRFELRALRDRPPLPPRDLWARTAAAIEMEASTRSMAGRGSPRRLLLAPSALIATALVVAVAIGTLTSSQRNGGDGSGGSPPEVAAASASHSSIGASGRPLPTPIRVATKVEYLTQDNGGEFKVNTKNVETVCPAGTEDCDTGAPAEQRPVTVDQNASSVFGNEDGDQLIVLGSTDPADGGTVSVVALPSGPSPSPTATATATAIVPASLAPSVAPTDTSTPTNTPRSSPSAASPTPTPAGPTPTPTASTEPSFSIEITPSPSNSARIEIAHGVAVVGQTAAYSPSGSFFAFTARPLDGSAGPDIYVWQVGSATAERVTADGRSVFGSWKGDLVVGSSALDAQAGGSASSGAIRPLSFQLNLATKVARSLPQAGQAWRPTVDPSGRKAVYWSGTLRSITGPGFAPAAGRLVLGDWATNEPAASGQPDATPLTGDQTTARHEKTIAAGRVDDWDARWDRSGTHLAIWISDRQDPTVGTLSLYAVSAFDGSIDLKAPLLDAEPAQAGFALADGSLVWAEPAAASGSSGSIQLLAWTESAIGTVKTVTGPALVIR